MHFPPGQIIESDGRFMPQRAIYGHLLDVAVGTIVPLAVVHFARGMRNYNASGHGEGARKGKAERLIYYFNSMQACMDYALLKFTLTMRGMAPG